MARIALFAVVRRVAGFAVLAIVAAAAALQAQIPGRNVNMVSGTGWPDGDPFLQRQNEPSIAASTRNPLHLLAGANDYRTVDIPNPADGGEERGDAWLGVFKSFDGGQRWQSTLLPGYPQDRSPEGMQSPIRGYQAGADPVVRAGTNGLFYFSGLVFDRAQFKKDANGGYVLDQQGKRIKLIDGKSAIAIATFIDNNNQEASDSIKYLRTRIVASAPAGPVGNGTAFLDKPWMAVDIPRGGRPPLCSIATPGRLLLDGTRGPDTVQQVPAGTVYVAYSSITGSGTAQLRSAIMLTRSFDCGATWQPPIQVSRTEDPVNQGATIAIDPNSGTVFVAWRRIATAAFPTIDAMMVAKLSPGGRKFSTPGVARRFPGQGNKKGLDPERYFEHHSGEGQEGGEVAKFDQGTSSYSFRSNAYPTMAVDGDGRVYVAWSERGFASASIDPTIGDARIVVTTTLDGTAFTPPQPIDEKAQLGHQIMPSMAFAGGKLMVVYYDVRDTRARAFGEYVTDQQTSTGSRHTIDIRAAMASPGAIPDFEDSVKVSDYLMGYRTGNGATGEREQLQFNPPNLPMFQEGTVPFIGDYIDLTPAPAFISRGKGRWAYNTAATSSFPVFHAAWTDNRDVRKPKDGNWKNYAPPRPDGTGAWQSLIDGTTVPSCQAGNAGSRNQNIYTARIAGGLLTGSPGNSKPLSPELQRGFVVFAQNATASSRVFRMSVASQPPGGRASFSQFPLPPAPPVTYVDVIVPARTTASRTVYITSTDPHASVSVDVSELDEVGDPVALDNGLRSTIVLNPDIENPDIENPDIENPDIENPDIENVEIYNPDIENPDIENPDIENPDIENPDIENPDIENIIVANPDIENPDIENPDIENPDIENPDIENPDIENPDIENGTITDVTWTVTNTGNTTAAFNVNLFLARTAAPPQGVQTQLLLHKVYKTPVTTPNGCELKYESRNVIFANIANPVFLTPSSTTVFDQNDPSEKNGTLWLAPGEVGKITLRVMTNDQQGVVTVINDKGEQVKIFEAFNPQTEVVPAVASQGVDPEDPVGTTEPPLVTPSGSNLFFIDHPSNVTVGQAIAPAVNVQVRDNASGAPVPGVAVGLSLLGDPVGVILGGSSAITGPDGVAMFGALTVSAAGTYQLLASATAAGVTATAVSNPFTAAPAIPLTVVINTNDGGPGSLRAAIEAANSTPGIRETITFAIPGAGPLTPAVIDVVSNLPALTDPVEIDASTQSGYDGLPVVHLRSSVPASMDGFTIAASDVTIRGFSITRFWHGILSSGGTSGHVIENNLVGLTRASVPGDGNKFGIVWRANSSQIRNNVLSGNGEGISINNGASNNTLKQNLIGTDPTGVSARPNSGHGVVLYNGADGNTIELNVISGNGGWGIDMQNAGSAVADTIIRGNTIGLGIDGSLINTAGPDLSGETSWGPVVNFGPSLRGNRQGGVRARGPGTQIGQPGAGNIISGNTGHGIVIDTSVGPTPVKVQGNYVGLDPTGARARGNTLGGIEIHAANTLVGGYLSGEGNVISANIANGIVTYSTATGVVIAGNLIGTDRTGMSDSDASGLTAIPLGQGKLMSPDPGCCHAGIFVMSSGTVVAANLISGNTYGIRSSTAAGGVASQIDNNRIGTTILGLGNGVLPNSVGVFLAGDKNGTQVTRNVITGSFQEAIQIAEGTTDAQIGGGGALGNTIVNNGRSIFVGYNELASDVRNNIQGNTIAGNGGFPIDLGNDGPTANDPDDFDGGPNRQQNYPLLDNALDTGAATEVEGYLNSIANESYRIDVYWGPTCGAATVYLGADLAVTDPSGDSSFSVTVGLPAANGGYVKATATDAFGNTSEMSGCVPMSDSVVVPGTAGGTVNDNFGGGAAAAGGTAPVSTGIVLTAGQSVEITATGAIGEVSWTSRPPSGITGGTDPSFLAPAINAFALVGRIGGGPWQFIGSGPTILTAGPGGGLLELAVNDSFYADNVGAFTALVTRLISF